MQPTYVSAVADILNATAALLEAGADRDFVIQRLRTAATLLSSPEATQRRFVASLDNDRIEYATYPLHIVQLHTSAKEESHA